jgi:hypothetical protein
MKKITTILGLAAVAAVVGTIGWQALAETPMHGGPQGMGMMMGMGGAHSRMAGAFGAPPARLASLKTELGITAQEEPAWDAYAKAVQNAAMSMKGPHDGMAMHSMSDQDRQTFMTQMRDQHEKVFAPVKAAAEQLLGALDDAQKTKAKEILPGLVPHGFGMMRHAETESSAAPLDSTTR